MSDTKIENALWLTNEEERVVEQALRFLIDRETIHTPTETAEHVLAKLPTRAGPMADESHPCPPSWPHP